MPRGDGSAHHGRGAGVLAGRGPSGAVLRSLLQAIDGHVRRRVGVGAAAGAVLFSNQYGPLGQSEGAREVLAAWQ